MSCDLIYCKQIDRLAFIINNYTGQDFNLNAFLVCVCVCVCTYACRWRMEIDGRYLLKLFSTLFMRQNFSLNLELTGTGCPVNPEINLSPNLQHWGYRCVCHTWTLLGTGDLNSGPFLSSAWQAHDWLGHLLNPSKFPTFIHKAIKTQACQGSLCQHIEGKLTFGPFKHICKRQGSIAG